MEEREDTRFDQNHIRTGPWWFQVLQPQITDARTDQRDNKNFSKFVF